MNQPTGKKHIGKRLARIVLKTILFVVLFFILVVALILTPPVQNFIRKKTVSYLENKLETHVEVGRIYIGLPKKIILEDIYIEDRQRDTLLAAASIKVNMSILKLIFKNEIDIGSIQLNSITAAVKRQLPDTAFNYQFIADAFTPASTASSQPADTSFSFAIRSLTLDKARLVYKDVLTGNDIEAWIDHLDTRVDKINPEKLQIDIPLINLQGTTARVLQTQPLISPTPLPASPGTTAKPVTTIMPRLSFGEINLEQVNLDYRNEASALYTDVRIGTLYAEPRTIDFTQQLIDFSSLTMKNTNATLRLGQKKAAEVLVNETKEVVDSSLEKGWQLNIASFTSANNNLEYDNDNFPRQPSGIDYAHLKISSLLLDVNNFSFAEDAVSGEIKNASFSEQSGFELLALRADFAYSGNEAWLQNLYLKTPGTELKRSIAIHYASIQALQNNIGDTRISLEVENSRIQVKDILSFAPSLRSQPAFADPAATWYIHSRLEGTIDNLTIHQFQLAGLSDTKIDIRGHIAGLPELDQYHANLKINNISSSQRDINLFLPPGSLPKQITLPSRFTLNGTLRGNTDKLTAALSAKSELGNARVNGTFAQLNDPKNLRYDAIVETESLDLGSILQDNQNFGSLSAALAVKGNTSTEWLEANGTIHSVVLKKYTYRDLQLKGSLTKQVFTLDASIMDPNIHATIQSTGNVSPEKPSAQFTVMIDSLKTQALHLTTDSLIFRGKIDGDFASLDPDELQGTLFLTQFLLVQKEQRFQLDTLQLIAGSADSIRSLRLLSDIAIAELRGQYRLTELGAIFQHAIQPYFSLDTDTTATPPSVYDFTLNASVINSLPLLALAPGLERMDSLQLESRFSNTGWNAIIATPAIDYAGNRIRGLNLKMETTGDSIQADMIVDQISSATMNLYATSLKATIADNAIRFNTNTRDRAGETRYNFSAVFRQPRPGQYSFSFVPDNLLLNYEKWSISNGNQIVITPDNITAVDFVLSKSGQQLSIGSISPNESSPLEVRFENFRLATITAFVQTDSSLVNGNMNGSINFTNILNDPIFEGDLDIADLSIRNDTVGNLAIHVNKTSQNIYNANATLSGRGNDIRLEGKYYASANTNSRFDLDLNIARLSLTTIQAFSKGALTSSSGHVNGKFVVAGTLQDPEAKGELNFDQAAFKVSQLNSYFRIDKEKLEVNENGIRFNRLEIRDSLNNPMILNGTADTRNFINYQFDFSIRANNFQAINSTKKDNDLFYGQLFFNTNLDVKGTEKAPVINGRVTINEKTSMTVVLPQREPGIVEREGVIEFIDMDASLNDSLFLAAYDSLNTTSLLGMEISTNIEIDKEARFSLVIDEGNGDFLNVRGEASLNAGIDPSGKLTLAGSYELEEGSYELTFNFIRRKFEIQKGSKIIWLGEPTDADVDITAKYIANTAPLDLVKNQLGENISAAQRNTYLQKIPFDVMLYMEGKLLKPSISFDIQLPEDKNYNVSNDILTTVRTKLEQLRQETAELNKQVFAVLLLNRFIGENPFNSSSETIGANTFARQSVSKLLTEQLNRLAEDLIEGVDLNFDVISSEDYTTGERRDRTDLNIGLSKKLLSDRLTVSIGSNFELEGPQQSNQRGSNIAGNVALNYRVSSDGRYILRAYRKNEYEGVIDGYIVETGISFIITVDYNRFRQIFLSKEQREKRRENRRKARRERRQQADTIVPEQTQP